ncbi:hypothetical protein DFS21_104302 [Pseudomonas sp. 2848]|jgi:hypothetical protein|nr:hypothetical protein DFS21_104302 [Pseudomonas sp. 2848]
MGVMLVILTHRAIQSRTLSAWRELLSFATTRQFEVSEAIGQCRYIRDTDGTDPTTESRSKVLRQIEMLQQREGTGIQNACKGTPPRSYRLVTLP